MDGSLFENLYGRKRRVKNVLGTRCGFLRTFFIIDLTGRGKEVSDSFVIKACPRLGSLDIVTFLHVNCSRKDRLTDGQTDTQR